MDLVRRPVAIASRTFRRLADTRAFFLQAARCRLSTKTGTLPSDPAYGFSLLDLVNAGLTQDALARVPLQVQAQLELIPGAAAVAVEASRRQLPNRSWALDLAVTITPENGVAVGFTVSADGSAVTVA